MKLGRSYIIATLHTGSGPFGGTRRLILETGVLLLAVCAWKLFLSLAGLSIGLWNLSSCTAGGEIGLPSLATHLLSSYLKGYEAD